MAQETEGISLDAELLRQGVSAVFSDSRKGRYFVLELEGALVASLLIQTEWSDWRNGEVWWIHSVFVEPEHRRKGLFRMMYAELKARALQTEAVRGLRLYVEKSNHLARQTYNSLGMKDDHYDLFEWMKTF